MTNGHLHLLLALTVALAVTGCKPANDNQADSSDSPPKLRVALVMKSLANEFFSTMEMGAKKHQQAHAADYELIANGIKDELDVSKQIELVEQMIAQKVN